MDPALPSNANVLLRGQGLKPRKRWGQNFLCDKNTLERIAGSAALQSDEHLLEIGPGLGALTRCLAPKVASVTAVEIDTLLKPILDETLASHPNVRVLYEDFLALDLSKLLDEAFGDRQGVVVANIPYYITTPIIERLLEHKSRIRIIVLLVQLEFAERMAAGPGSKDYSALSLYIQYNTRAEITGRVSKHVFLPPPEVDSAIIALTPVEGGTVEVNDPAFFFQIIRSAFGQRRKTLWNALTNGQVPLDREQAQQIIERAGIDPQRRGETLTMQEFAALADARALPNADHS